MRCVRPYVRGIPDDHTERLLEFFATAHSACMLLVVSKARETSPGFRGFPTVAITKREIVRVLVNTQWKAVTNCRDSRRLECVQIIE